MTRIALVSSSFLPYIGGVETHVRQLAGQLRARGHEVEVWVVDRGQRTDLPDAVDGIPVRWLPTPLPARSAAALMRFAGAIPAAARAWRRAERAFRPDVLNVQCFGPNGAYALALATLTRVPLVVSSHGETFADDHGAFEESDLLRLALRRAGARAATVTACSQLVADDLGRFGVTQVQVVPNAVPDVSLSEVAVGQPGPLKPAWSAQSELGAYVLGVGRLEHIKGFDQLLRAFAAAELEDHQLVLAGEGGARLDLEHLAGALGIAERVHFTGAVAPERVRELMVGAQVLAIPSRREAFGIVVLEGWAAGAPMVVTREGWPGQSVRHGSDGLVADAGDPGAFGASLSAVARDADLRQRLARAGRSRVREFTWGSVVQDYERIYDDVRARP